MDFCQKWKLLSKNETFVKKRNFANLLSKKTKLREPFVKKTKLHETFGKQRNFCQNIHTFL